MFVRVCDMLSTRFQLFFVENLVANLLHQSRHVEINAAGSLVRARARQMECRKKPFRASQRTCWSWIFVTYFTIRAYHDVIKWKYAMKKLDLTPQNVINCVHNEPDYGTQNSPTSVLKLLHVGYQLVSLAFISGSIVLYASYLCLSLIILFNPCGVFPFLRLGRYHCGT